MKKLVIVVGLMADFGPGVTLALAGLALIIGGSTGALWM